ncbi:hypothetical protein GGR98_002203 [Parageobacillus caldoxylosilyticus]|jgi:hypothetical protein|nr:hypothetical protein [Parageobacillus caldoxylosilyticus]
MKGCPNIGVGILFYSKIYMGDFLYNSELGRMFYG